MTPNLGVPRTGLCGGYGISLQQISRLRREEDPEKSTGRRRVADTTHSRCLEPRRSILHDFLGMSKERK